MTGPLLALLREWLRHPWQLALTLLGVSLGVAVVVAVDLANVSAEREFLRATGALDGLATHRIAAAAGGIDEELYRVVKVEARVRDAAPVLELAVRIGERRLRLIGIDPLSDYRVRGFDLLDGGGGEGAFPLFLSAAAMDSLGLARGDPVPVRFGESERRFHVAGRLASGQGALPDDVMVSDIAAVQVLSGRAGRISHIELRLPAGGEAAVSALLPAGVNLVSTEARNHARLEMTRAFRINLTALGLLALVIGLFLVYNTVSFQAVRRRPLFGLLRALGVTADGILGYLLAEAALVGVVGAVLGVAAGIVLGHGLYALVAGTVDALYYRLAGAIFEVDAWTLAKGAGLGIGATLLAALLPALEARRVPPRGLMTRSGQEPRRRALLPRLAAACLVVACIVIVATRDLVPAFAGLFLVIVGVAALAPALLSFLSGVLSTWLAARGMRLGALAARNVGAHLSRTGLAAAALSVAVAAALGAALRIYSFRGSFEDWLHDYLRADIYISGVGGPGLSERVVDGLPRLDGVEAVSLGRRFAVDTAAGSVDVFVLQTVPQGFAGFRFRDTAVEDPWAAFQDRGQVLVSEPLANRRGIRVGDSIELPGDQGVASFPVAGVYYDYSSERGVVAMSPATAAAHYHYPGFHSAALYVTDGARVDLVVDQFRERFDPEGALVVRSNRALREASLQVFDQTFRITGILRLLAVIVAVTGIVSALLALQLERSRDYAVLRAGGFTRGQLGLQVLGETALTGLASGILAIPLGIALCVLLIHVINLRSFGWTMQTAVDPVLVGQSLLLAVGAALLAGLYPAWRLRGLDVARGLRGD